MAGEGKPVLLVHGFGASVGHWRKNIPLLAQTHKVWQWCCSCTCMQDMHIIWCFCRRLVSLLALAAWVRIISSQKV